MQIRRRQQSITLIRNIYCPVRKRCWPVIVATLPTGLMAIPAGLVDRLTEDERHQLETLCAENRRHGENVQRETVARQLPTLLAQVAAWYRQQPKRAEWARLAEDSRQAWTEVLAAMCAAGVGRTRRRKSRTSRT